MSGCFDNFFIGSVRSAETDIILNRIVKQINVLKDHAYIFKQTVASELFYVMSSNRYTAALYVVKPRDKIAERRFASSARPDDCGRCILRNTERYAVQNFAPLIAEYNIFEFSTYWY